VPARSYTKFTKDSESFGVIRAQPILRNFFSFPFCGIMATDPSHLWTSSTEPHALRRKHILKKHPEVSA
jgi:hypothetical protein